EIVPGLRIDGGYFLLHVNGGPKGPVSPTDPTVNANAGTTFQGSDVSHGPSLGISFRQPMVGAGAYLWGAANTGGDYAFGGNYRRGELFGNLSLLENRVGGSLRGGFTTVQNDWFEKVDSGAVQAAVTSWYLDVGARGNITD